MVVSNRNFLFQWSIFRGYVSFREGKGIKKNVVLYDSTVRVAPQSPVVLVTYDSAPKIAHSYDLLFIDESDQAMVGHLLAILARQQSLLKVALVGDDKQLPTFTEAELWTQSNITESS